VNVTYCTSWYDVTFLTCILEVIDLNLNGILTVLAEIACSRPQSLKPISGNIHDKLVNAMKHPSVENCDRCMCF
jgi:hypothetical protein